MRATPSAWWLPSVQRKYRHAASRKPASACARLLPPPSRGRPGSCRGRVATGRAASAAPARSQPVQRHGEIEVVLQVTLVAARPARRRRRGARRRTGGPARAAGTEAAAAAKSTVTNDVRTSSSSTSSAGGLSSSRHTAANASSSQPPANTLIARRAACAGAGQELCAPVEGGMHRAVAGHDAVAGQRQLLDRLFEPIGEIRQRQRPAACRGELEPERDAVQTTAHGGHGHGVVRAQRAGRHVDRQPGDEQCARRRVLDLLERGRRGELPTG